MSALQEEVESDTVFVMEKPLKEPQRKPELFDEPERRLYAPTAADLMSRAVSRPTMCETPAASTGSESYSRASRSSGGERRDALFQRLLGHKRPHPHCYTTGVYPASRQLEPCESYDSLKSERSNIRYLAKMVRPRDAYDSEVSSDTSLTITSFFSYRKCAGKH